MKKLILAFILCCSNFPVYADAVTILTDDLDGKAITYEYSGGRSYEIKFVDGNMSYRYLTGSKPEKWWGPFAYKATLTEHGEYFVAWYEDGYGDYITLLVNLKTNILYGSGILGDQSLHFEKAMITRVQ